ncbi:MAG: hypothetical protein LAN62_17140, partial [Acidobacteriia bacterium]|nr:hypothetical protein [Terriglobia bacterium]
MLSPSLVILSEAKDPAISLRVNSAKHLCILPVNRGESSMGFPERQRSALPGSCIAAAFDSFHLRLGFFTSSPLASRALSF